MVFSTRITVNFGDTDPAGLVYFPNIFHYCHIAMERFFQEVCGVSYSKLTGEQHVGFPTVRIDGEFMIPLRYGDEIEITMTVSKVGTKSISLSYKVTNSEGLSCADISQVIVAMDLSNHSSIPIPGSIRRSFQP